MQINWKFCKILPPLNVNSIASEVPLDHPPDTPPDPVVPPLVTSKAAFPAKCKQISGLFSVTQKPGLAL